MSMAAAEAAIFSAFFFVRFSRLVTTGWSRRYSSLAGSTSKSGFSKMALNRASSRRPDPDAGFDFGLPSGSPSSAASCNLRASSRLTAGSLTPLVTRLTLVASIVSRIFRRL
uniref:Uncharacterized protein n=1 Tax=Ixodes ricinus TaxID=34613 RepID=A0A6B0UK51_IXORI